MGKILCITNANFSKFRHNLGSFPDKGGSIQKANLRYELYFFYLPKMTILNESHDMYLVMTILERYVFQMSPFIYFTSILEK